MKLNELLLKKATLQKNYPFLIRTKFCNLGPFFGNKTNKGQIALTPDDSRRDLSQHPVDITSCDNIFIETYIAQGMIFKGKTTGIITMKINPGFK